MEQYAVSATNSPMVEKLSKITRNIDIKNHNSLHKKSSNNSESCPLKNPILKITRKQYRTKPRLSNFLTWDDINIINY